MGSRNNKEANVARVGLLEGGGSGAVGDDVGDEEYRIQLLHGMSWELLGR